MINYVKWNEAHFLINACILSFLVLIEIQSVTDYTQNYLFLRKNRNSEIHNER